MQRLMQITHKMQEPTQADGALGSGSFLVIQRIQHVSQRPEDIGCGNGKAGRGQMAGIGWWHEGDVDVMPLRTVIFGNFNRFLAVAASGRSDHVGPDGGTEECPLISINIGRNVCGEQKGVMRVLAEQFRNGLAFGGAEIAPG